MKVLLVDDEENMQAIMAAFLRRYCKQRNESLDLKALFDPVQGLFEATTDNGSYDLIVLDVRLPRLTGDEIYQNLMRVRPELLDRVLFVTGYREDLDARFPDRELRVLDKPFRFHALKAAIDAMFDRAPAA